MVTVCSLLQSLLCGNKEKPHIDFLMDLSKLLPLICTTFLFSYVWGLGGNLVEKSMDAFDTFCRDLFSETHDVKVNCYRYQYIVCSYCADSKYGVWFCNGLFIEVTTRECLECQFDIFQWFMQNTITT